MDETHTHSLSVFFRRDGVVVVMAEKERSVSSCPQVKGKKRKKERKKEGWMDGKGVRGVLAKKVRTQ
jgi:hypothetical protein